MTLNLANRVEEALSQVRPYLQADGGNVSVIEITGDMTVRLRFHGACSACTMSTMTLKAGIEQTIMKMVPEIKKVEAISENDEMIA